MLCSRPLTENRFASAKLSRYASARHAVNSQHVALSNETTNDGAGLRAHRVGRHFQAELLLTVSTTPELQYKRLGAECRQWSLVLRRL